MCHVSRAPIEDVMLYRTGGISACALAASASEKSLSYCWSICDLVSNVFKGGLVLLTGPLCCRNVAVCDFVSMHPSIIASCNIYPECVDYMGTDTGRVQVYKPSFI